MYFQLEEQNQVLKKQIHGLKCKLDLDKQNADLLVRRMSVRTADFVKS